MGLSHRLPPRTERYRESAGQGQYCCQQETTARAYQQSAFQDGSDARERLLPVFLGYWRNMAGLFTRVCLHQSISFFPVTYTYYLWYHFQHAKRSLAHVGERVGHEGVQAG